MIMFSLIYVGVFRPHPSNQHFGFILVFLFLVSKFRNSLRNLVFNEIKGYCLTLLM